MRQEAVTVLKLDATQHDAAAARAAAAIGRVGVAGQNTAKQTAAAMRSLPAQFTDVATQLAGGQNPLLILLQQGGQIRDQFGSIGAAAKGIASFLSPVALGFAAAATGAGSLALAYKQASAEQDALLRGLVLSGNAAGTTRDELNELARAQDNVAGTRALAASTLGALASSGAVAAEQLSMATSAAIALQRAGGPAVEDTAKKFIQLGAAPLQTLVQLNQAENFLTRSIYDQVRALTERGEIAQAANVAQQAYATALSERARTLEAELGSIQRAWRGITDFAAEAWDAMLGIGRPQTLQQQLSAAVQQLAEAGEPRRGGNNLQADARRAAIRQRIEDLRLEIYLQGEQAAAEQSRAQREAKYFKDQSTTSRRARTGDPIADAEQAVQDRIERWWFANQQALDRLDIEQLRDPLGEFLTERVLPADQQRNEQRLDQTQQFLRDLVDANARANLELIADDEQRALAQVALERQMLQRRIDALQASPQDRAYAQEQADIQAATQFQAVQLRFAKDTALVTREETRDALAAAFRDSKNPLAAFGDALGNIIFQRVSASLADALVNAFIGTAADGVVGGVFGSLFGGLFNAKGNAFGPSGLVPFAMGGVVDRPTMFTYGGGKRGVMGEAGEEAILPLRRGRNGALGVQAQVAGGGGPVVNLYQTNHIGQGVSRSEVALALVQSKEAAKSELLELLQRNRRLD